MIIRVIEGDTKRLDFRLHGGVVRLYRVTQVYIRRVISVQGYITLCRVI